MMAARKREPGANKEKEMHLLTGLIYCGRCGSTMQGNRRKPKDKPRYVSYMCGCRVQKRGCDNKKIRKEYVEQFVLTELEKSILNDKAVPILVEKINKHIEEQSKHEKESVEIMLRELSEVRKHINNIVVAITNGFYQSEFKDKMEELEKRKSELELSIKELEVKNMFAMFKGYVLDRNIPECKKFIQNYVHKVIVYKDHVEVIFNVAFNFLQEKEIITITASARKRTLFKICRGIA